MLLRLPLPLAHSFLFLSLPVGVSPRKTSCLERDEEELKCLCRYSCFFCQPSYHLDSDSRVSVQVRRRRTSAEGGRRLSSCGCNGSFIISRRLNYILSLCLNYLPTLMQAVISVATVFEEQVDDGMHKRRSRRM